MAVSGGNNIPVRFFTTPPAPQLLSLSAHLSVVLWKRGLRLSVWAARAAGTVAVVDSPVDSPVTGAVAVAVAGSRGPFQDLGLGRRGEGRTGEELEGNGWKKARGKADAATRKQGVGEEE